MRFQQLKRDPNAVMRKKLVKSKKNWIVVSSLSIAGGLFLMGGPSTVAKADATESVTTEAVAPSTPTAPSSTVTKSSVKDSVPAPTTDSDAAATGTEKADTATPVTDAGTTVKTADGTKDSTVTPETTTDKTTEPVKEDTEVKAPVEQPAETPTTEQTTKVAAVPAPASTTVATTDPESDTPVASTVAADGTTTKDDVVTGSTDVGDVSAEKASDTATVKVADLTKLTTDADALKNSALLETGTDLTDSTLLAAAAIAPVAAAPTDVPADQDSWNVTEDGKTLTITGQLSEGDGTYHERWGGHTDTIETINVQDPVIVAPTDPAHLSAPKNSSYLFANMTNLTSVNIANLDTSATTNMQGMFQNDPNITNVSLDSNDLMAVTDISHMFENDHLLTNVDISETTPFKKLQDASYAFANDWALTNMDSMNSWQGWALTDLSGMFKNDSKINKLNLAGIDWTMYGLHPNTGDSSKGQGMFDGTHLETIRLNNFLSFSPNTALTSTKGGQWVSGKDSSGKTYSFYGVPSTDASGISTPGIGSLYTGEKVTSQVAALDYTATTVDDGTPISNLITVNTNRGQISFIASGKVGETSTVNIPSTFTDEYGNTYNLASDSSKTVQVKFGQTEFNAATNDDASKNVTATYQGTPNKSTSVPVINPDGSRTTLGIPFGYGGVTKPISPDHIDGYVDPAVTITYTDSGIPKVTQYGKDIDENNPVRYTGVTNASHSIPVTSPKNATNPIDSLPIPEGKYGDTPKTVDVPAQNGYDSTSVVVTYNASGTSTVTQNGKTVDATHPITYTGATNKASSVAVTTPAGSTIPTTLDIPAGKYGETATVNGKTVAGYEVPVLTVTYGPKGTPTITQKGEDGSETTIDENNPVTYTGVTNGGYSIPVTSPKNATTPIESLPIPAGKYGDTPKTVDVPAQNGYEAASVVVTYNANGTSTVTQDGKPVDKNNPITYTGKTNKSYSIPVTSPKNATDPINGFTIPEGKYGDDPVTVTLPAQDGYDSTSVVVTYNANGTSTVTQDGKPVDKNNPITYTGKTNKSYSIPVTNPKNATDPINGFTIPEGKYGDDPVTVTLPAQDGYEAASVVVTYNANGTSTVTQDGKPVDKNNPITYTGKTNKSYSIPVTNPKNATDPINGFTIPEGKYGDDPVTVTLPAQDGYDSTSVVVTYNANGTSTVTQDGKPVDKNNPITYTGKTNKSYSIPVTNPKNATTPIDSFTIPEGKYGDDPVTVTLPAQDGYEAASVVVAYNANGTSTVTQNNKTVDKDNPITYTGVTNAAQKLTIKNPDGTTAELSIPAGNYGDEPVTVTAPAVSGYKAPSVIVSYNADGQPTFAYANDPTKAITTADELSYTKNPSARRSTPNVRPVVTTPSEGAIEHKVQTISAHSDTSDVTLYQLGSDNKMSPITDYDLANASNWYSDATTTIDGVSYYRVATNEWAKASQAYPYQGLNLNIRTYNDSEKELYKAEDVIITNETLAPSSSWFTDREIYIINNTKYYRVASDKYVNANDVYVYTPVNMVVKTHTTKYTTVYDAKGIALTNKLLINDSSWRVDSITYINGEKYYRVATDEFVKASDVDVNNML